VTLISTSVNKIRENISLVSISSIGIISIFLLLILNVVSLQVGRSVPLFRELSIFILVWVVFFSQGSSQIYESNIRISYFFDRLSNRNQRIVSVLATLVVFTTNVALVISGIIGIFQVRGTTTSVANIPVELLYLPLIIGITIAVVCNLVEAEFAFIKKYRGVK